MESVGSKWCAREWEKIDARKMRPVNSANSEENWNAIRKHAFVDSIDCNFEHERRLFSRRNGFDCERNSIIDQSESASRFSSTSSRSSVDSKRRKRWIMLQVISTLASPISSPSFAGTASFFVVSIGGLVVGLFAAVLTAILTKWAAQYARSGKTSSSKTWLLSVQLFLVISVKWCYARNSKQHYGRNVGDLLQILGPRAHPRAVLHPARAVHGLPRGRDPLAVADHRVIKI